MEPNALIEAAQQGDLETLTRLLDAEPGMRTSQAGSWRGQIALHAAATNGHCACVEALLAREADAQINFSNSLGETAVMLAAECGHAESLQAILILLPFLCPAARSAALLASNRYRETPLMLAAKHGHAACVEALLLSDGTEAAEAQVQAADIDGWNAVMHAAHGGHCECIRLLLRHIPEAQVRAQRHDGSNALMAATLEGHAECVRCLLEAATPQEQSCCVDQQGRTALEWAAREGGSVDCLRILIPHASISRPLDRAFKQICLRYTASPSHSLRHTIELLLAQGARVPTGRDLARNPRISDALHPIISDAAYRALLPQRLGAVVRAAVRQGEDRAEVASSLSDDGGAAAVSKHSQRAGKRARLLNA